MTNRNGNGKGRESHGIGVIGCGYWGPNLIRNFGSLDHVEVRKVCDTDESRLDYIRSLYHGVTCTTEVDEVFDDESIDAVVIATPVSTHFDLAGRSLRTGKHTFIEKPMARTSEECTELIRLANAHSLTLMVGHTFLYSPSIQKIREIIDSGDIGEVLHVSCRRLNLGIFQKDINVAWDLAPHDISIILYLLDENPVSVNCTGHAHLVPGVEDVTSISLGFRNGGTALIQSSWIDPRKVRDLTIVGSKKMILYDDTEPLEKIRVYDKHVELPPYYDTFAEFHYAYHYGGMYSPYVQQVEPLKVECRRFVECIETRSESESSGTEGRRVVMILEAATRSLSQGGAPVAPADNSRFAKSDETALTPVSGRR